MVGENWVQNMLNDQKLGNYLELSNRTNQLARSVHSASKRHQDVVFWVDVNLAIRKVLTHYQTRSNAIILQGTLPALLPKVVRLKTGEVLYENEKHVTSTSAKDLTEAQMDKRLGFES